MSETKIAVPFLASSADPEVPAKEQRRKFGAQDKKRILDEVDRDRTRRHWRRGAAGGDLFLDVARLAQGTRCGGA